VDQDHDGDLDAALSRQDAPGFWWYERRGDSVCVQYVINDSPKGFQGLGATALDVDGAGDVDIVSKIWNKDGPTYHADYWRNDTPWHAK